MADLLRTCRIAPTFEAALRVDLVEASPRIAESQRQTLAQARQPIAWHGSLDTVPPGPTILIANEFFDAIAIRQLERRGGRWHERVIGLGQDGNLGLGLAPDPVDDRLVPAWAGTAGEGAIAEISPARGQLAEAVGARLAAAPSLALIIDYGHLASATGDTLQAVAGHRRAALLDRPGEADITAHVDFAALAGALREAGAAVYPAMDQGSFLAAMGLAARVAVLQRGRDAAAQAETAAAAARLAAADQIPPPRAKSAGVKLPAPLPSRTETLSDSAFATARSVLTLPPRLAATSERGALPTGSGEVPAAVKLPVPLPSRMLTLSESLFATARSRFPSPPKLPVASPLGASPTPSSELAGSAKSPLALPSRTVTLSCPCSRPRGLCSRRH